MRVSVPFGKKNTYTGLIVKVHKKKPGYEVRDALELPDQKPVIMDSQLALWQWMSTYYMCSEGEIFKAALPARLNLTKKTRKKKPVAEENTFLLSVLNQPQQLALDEIKNKFSTLDVVLLHGITSSGKTEVYIHLIEEAIKNGGQVLYLLPEIALTTQIINRLSKAFGPGIAVYHSKYSDSERIKTWNRMVNEEPGSEKAVRIVLGVRSAIFLPFQKLGLIIVDEEHENTYKQFDPAPRYHARDTAIMLARQCGAKVLLGTATPSIETYHNCKTGKYGLVELNERYRNLQLPEIIVENTRTLRRRKQMQSHFSPMLLQQIQEALKNGEQVILFQNRRGFSLFLVCDQCGAVPRCKHCDVSLTYHKRNNRLYCHYCGYHTHVPAHCPECSEGNLQMKGFGTEKIEEEIGLFFPEARIERMDLDAARSRKTYETLIARFELKQSDILVGTQMISKGLNFDNVKLVGILDADTMLNFPDFRAHERSYQLMSQVSGRAGRRNNRGKVIIQTSYDQHPIVTCVVNNNYQAMYADQIDERYRFSYPPFSRLIKITLKHKDTGRVDKAAEYLANILKETISAKILGPEYPLISRIQNFYLKNLLIKIEKFGQLQHIKQQIAAILNDIKSHEDFKAVQYVVDVDPF
jgi:primosomal protein N' (replication factor Y) (superfamily II helicase)